MTSLKDLTSLSCILSAIDQPEMKNSIIDFIHKNHIRAVLSQKDITAVGHLVVVITHPTMVNLALGIITNLIVRQVLVTFNKSEEDEFLGPWTEIECSVQDSKICLDYLSFQ